MKKIMAEVHRWSELSKEDKLVHLFYFVLSTDNYNQNKMQMCEID